MQRSSDVPEPQILLLRRIANGDREAFAALFDSLAPTTLGVLNRILRRRSLAEEVLEGVFLQVWKEAGLYRPEEGSVRGWLLRIARSRGLERLRHECSSGRREEPFEEQDETARREGGERRRRLLDILRQLPPDQRVCLELALFEGLTHSKIAARLAMPLETVKSAIRLGTEKIREGFRRKDAAALIAG